MKCPKCGNQGNQAFALVESGPHKKLICTACLAFVKFLSKSEAKNWDAVMVQKDTLKGDAPFCTYCGAYHFPDERTLCVRGKP